MKTFTGIVTLLIVVLACALVIPAHAFNGEPECFGDPRSAPLWCFSTTPVPTPTTIPYPQPEPEPEIAPYPAPEQCSRVCEYPKLSPLNRTGSPLRVVTITK